ncbi:MAG TPA: hypothetical protein EYP21_06460, partial [Syntrophaceae bacterium]|nr:hypothetical protein [Syntrophaceae bacterium]
MKKGNFVVWFKDLGRKDIPLVGGKCASLGELFGQIGIPVPDGFAISTSAYQVFLEKTHASKEIVSHNSTYTYKNLTTREIGKMVPDHTDRDYLIITITNIGRRP